MPKFITNVCGHIVTEDTFPYTLCRGKHMCGALFDPYGVSSDCLAAKEKDNVEVCKKCKIVQNRMIKAEKESPEYILKEAAKLLDCEPNRSVLEAIKKLRKKIKNDSK